MTNKNLIERLRKSSRHFYWDVETEKEIVFPKPFNRDGNEAAALIEQQEAVITSQTDCIAALSKALTAMLPEHNTHEQHLRPDFETCEQARLFLLAAKTHLGE